MWRGRDVTMFHLRFGTKLAHRQNRQQLQILKNEGKKRGRGQPFMRIANEAKCPKFLTEDFECEVSSPHPHIPPKATPLLNNVLSIRYPSSMREKLQVLHASCFLWCSQRCLKFKCEEFHLTLYTRMATKCEE